MIKKIVSGICLVVVGLSGFAQQHMPGRAYTYSDETPSTGFNKENLFVGGSLNVGFSSYTFNIGGAPEIGYSLTRWLDAGVLVNINYNSERADPQLIYNDNTRYRSFNYGVGAFGRAYVLPFLFVAVQPEFNWIDYNTTYMGTPGGQTITYNTTAPSLLLGVGYAQRVIGQGSFYISLMFDALSNANSPYRDFNGAAIPVIKAGFDFYLHKSR